MPFADTTARRAQLMAATEQFKTSINNGVESIKEGATEVGKSAAFVAGAALAVYLVVNTVLPKSDEYRYAEKFGEPSDDEWRNEEDDEDESVPESPRAKANRKQTKEIKKSAAASGLIGGLITSVLTNIAREQLTGFLARIRTNNAINPTAQPTEYHQKAPTEPVDYTS